MKDPFKLNAKSIMALYELFPTEEACIKHLEAINWHGKPVSPFDKTSKVYKLKSGKYRCKNTGKNFTVRTGTMFEKTKISLRKWFIAIWLVTFNNYYSSLQTELLAPNSYFVWQSSQVSSMLLFTSLNSGYAPFDLMWLK